MKKSLIFVFVVVCAIGASTTEVFAQSMTIVGPSLADLDVDSYESTSRRGTPSPYQFAVEACTEYINYSFAEMDYDTHSLEELSKIAGHIMFTPEELIEVSVATPGSAKFQYEVKFKDNHKELWQQRNLQTILDAESFANSVARDSAQSLIEDGYLTAEASLIYQEAIRQNLFRGYLHNNPVEHSLYDVELDPNSVCTFTIRR